MNTLTQHQQHLAEIQGLTGELRQSTRDVITRIEEARAELAPPPPIAFVHIPKTAGATVKSMFANAYGKDALRDAGNYPKRPEGAVLRVASPPQGGWDAWARRGGRVTVGHTPYGLFRKHLPPGTQYMTFLRDPVERVLSHYHRHIHLTGGPKDNGEEGEAALTTSIEQALENGLPEVSNLATRLLCAFPPPPEDLPPSALDEAKANLRNFAFVGIQERFEESVVLLQRKFGLGLVTYLNRHVSVDRPTSEEISDEQRSRIADRNRLDAELYEYAQGLFDVAVTQAGEGFAADVEALRVKSEGANEKAIRDACAWLLRELPSGETRPKLEMLAGAERDGISPAAVKELTNLLPVSRERDDDGEVIWSLTEEARGFASRGGLRANRGRASKGDRGGSGASNPAIAFVHLHRTAGDTVRFALDQAFSEGAIRGVRGYYFEAPDAMEARLMRSPRRDWATWCRGGGRIVAGRVPYGLYRKQLPPDTRYLTFQRDPLDRVISHYYAFIRRRAGEREEDGLTAGSLDEAVEELQLPQLNNLATRYLSGETAPLGVLPVSALEDAKRNLREFAFVGLLERFDESMVLLQQTLGRDIGPYLNCNVNLDRPAVDEISDEERAVVVDHNRLDAQLYAFAEELFEESLASVGDDFAAEVDALRASSARANEEAMEKALDWLDRELPAGISKPKRILVTEAERAGIAIPALKRSLGPMHVARGLDDDGQLIWTRPE